MKISAGPRLDIERELSQSRPGQPVSIAPEAVPPHWPEDELRLLREAVCRSVPPSSDAFWQSNAVWVGCTEIDENTSYEPHSAVRNLEIKIKAVGREDISALWDYYLKKERTLRELIAQSTDGVRIRIADLRVVKGSVEIILIIAIIKVGISLAGIILGFMQAFAAYDKIKAGFNDARVDCKAFVEKLVYRLKGFFGGFGEAPSPSNA